MHQALIEYARAVWEQSPGARLAMSVLLRRASSSAASLARSIERRIALLARPEASLVQPALPFLDAEPADDEPQGVLGVAGLHDATSEHVHLDRVLHLAHQASRAESKLLALRRLLTRAQEPAIVFTEYRDTLQQIASTLAGGDVALLHGGLRTQERAEALRRFTAGGARLLLATDAASEGLNLHQRCRLVVNLELPWTPVRLEQRVGRVDRIGQPRRVHALNLVAGGTSEETVLAALARRTSRIERTFQALEHIPTEQEVAACVIEGQPLPEAPARSSVAPDGIVMPDLRNEAQVEAARLATARALIARRHCWHDETRPVLARFRSPRQPPACYWLFTVIFVGADGRILWESALPLYAHLNCRPDRTNATTRTLLDRRQSNLRRVLDAALDAQRESICRMLRDPLALWRRREDAIAGALRERHARLSAGVLQLGLFDRREERAVAAQSALLADALAASAARLSEVAAAERPRLDSCQLVFGLARE
jgi:hypothetical protein